MIYDITDTGIRVNDLSSFDVRQIAECGQLFRYKYLQSEDCIRCLFFSADKLAEVRQYADHADIITKNTEYFKSYFDLDADYEDIKRCIAQNEAQDSPMLRAIQKGGGIRILRQDVNEVFFSFIISANNNIKRIQGIIERLCELCGEKTDGGYAFPSPLSLARLDRQAFAQIGCGYRSDYLVRSAAMWRQVDQDALWLMPTHLLRKTLTDFPGVGPKVADCIILFGLGRKDVFPVDTWIKKAYRDYFDDGSDSGKDIAASLCSRYGEYSGYAQQYMFFFQRENV